MVSAQAIDEICNPTKVIRRLYEARTSDGDFPSVVANHFSTVFFRTGDPGAVKQLPPLDIHHPPEAYTSGTMVRFRAMIQDTSSSPEMYLARLSDNRCGGWGMHTLQFERELDSFDYSDLDEVTTMWAVSVPGESAWCSEEISPPVFTSFPVHKAPRPHKFPISDAPHVGVQLKIYDSANLHLLKTTEVATFVGILASEPLDSEAEISDEISVLHVICYQVTSPDIRGGVDPQLRQSFINWVSSQACGGDTHVAEWLLLQLTSTVHTRVTPLLPPSLNISLFPQPPEPGMLPALSHVLVELLPQYIPIQLSLDVLNTKLFMPESKEEDLHAGYLQVPFGTTTLLTESGIQEGKLLEKGVMNIRAIQEVMNSQTLEYTFPFSKFTFNTDISFIVLSEGRKSAFFQSAVNVPLQAINTDNIYKQEILNTPFDRESMTSYRSYIAACRAAVGQIQYIQEDFVRWRQQDASTTADDLMHLMKVARLYAASHLQKEVTTEIWEQAKELETKRKVRLA
ncbi:putative alanine racemase-domain-containing protein [Phlebopus sp. FC_14]|nr:putative alanine racemase-domain-containing protein [Phlebopus sp. FC_14]